MGGAEVVHVSVNGLGEGGGNAPLEAVVTDLELMLGIDTGIKLERLYALSMLVQDLSGIPLQANWPLVGEKVFNTESGIAVDAYWKMAVSGLNVPMDKDISAKIGRSRQVVLGKMSGATSIEVKMMLLGLQKPEDDKVKRILEQVKKRSIELRRTLNDNEFKEIITSVTRS
jgi:isopropylmalate/homocitrate/citramalate synthase